MLDDPQLMNKLRSENFLPRIRGSKPPQFKCVPHVKFLRVHQVANAHLRKPAAGKDQAAPKTAVHEQQQQFVYRVVQRAGGPQSIAAGYSSSSTDIAGSQAVAHSQASNLLPQRSAASTSSAPILPADYKQPNNRPVYTRVQQVLGAAAAVIAAGISVVAAGSSHVKNYHPWNPSLLHEGAASSVVNGYFPKQDQASHHVIQIPSDLPDPLTAKLLPASTRDQEEASHGKKKQQPQEPQASLKTYTQGFFHNCWKYAWQTFLGFFSRLYGKKKQQPQEPQASLKTYTQGFFHNCWKYAWQTFLGFFSRLYSR
jgi:hypothetical protein